VRGGDQSGGAGLVRTGIGGSGYEGLEPPCLPLPIASFTLTFNFPIAAPCGEGSRLAHSTLYSGSRENRSYERSRLSTQAPRSWTVEGDQGHPDRGQISWKTLMGILTLWLGSGRPGDRGGQGVDGEHPDSEEGESSFEEHDDTECWEGNQIRTAPGLMFGRKERRTEVSCTAAEETGGWTSTIL